MVQRRKRLPVVLDTNVFVRALKAGSKTNWNRRIVHLWLIERQLQLVVSRELIAESLGIVVDVLGHGDGNREDDALFCTTQNVRLQSFRNRRGMWVEVSAESQFFN